MSGLPWAQIDSSFPADPRFKRLERRLAWTDYLAAVGLWTLVVADAWRVGDRGKGISALDLDADPRLTDALVSVGLLDEEGRIPAESWEKWGGRVIEKRKRVSAIRSEVGRLGGLRSSAERNRDHLGRFAPRGQPVDNSRDLSTGSDGLEPPSKQMLGDDRPSTEQMLGPHQANTELDRDREKERSFLQANALGRAPAAGNSGKTISKAAHRRWEEFPERWQRVKEAWIGRGLSFPPTEAQRAVLWPILDARPTDLVRWIEEADGSTGWEVVGSVLRRWASFQRGTMSAGARPPRNGGSGSDVRPPAASSPATSPRRISPPVLQEVEG
jgi:hypothetical protein